MAWTSEPTPAQLSAFYNLTKWALPSELGVAAIEWLKDAASRKQVSDELARLRGLYIKHNLRLREVVFAGDLWRGFNWRDWR